MESYPSVKKRGEHKLLPVLVHSLVKTVVKAYPTRDDEARQDLATIYFVNARLDESLEQHIYTTKLAVAYEYARRTMKKRSASIRPRMHAVTEPKVEQDDELETLKT